MAATENKSSLHRLLTAVVILLVVAVGVQTWFLYNLKQELSIVHEEQNTTPQSEITTETQKDQTPLQSQKVSDETDKTLSRTDVAAASDNPAPEKRSNSEEQAQAIAPDTTPRDTIPHDTTPPWADDNYFFPLFDAHNWNPYEEIQRMQRELDQRFNDQFNRFYNNPDFRQTFRHHMKTPELDVRENQYQYTVFVNLPGADKDDISVTLDGQRLTVSGRQDIENRNQDAMGNTVFRERRSSRFQRSITLREPVENNAMKTHIDDKGILTIIIPKMR